LRQTRLHYFKAQLNGWPVPHRPPFVPRCAGPSYTNWRTTLALTTIAYANWAHTNILITRRLYVTLSASNSPVSAHYGGCDGRNWWAGTALFPLHGPAAPPARVGQPGR